MEKEPGRGSGRDRGRRFGLIAVAVASGLVAPVVATGTAQATPATYYVSATGTDGAAGTSGHPFATIQHCADQATHPGDTCVIMPGTYREAVKVTHSGAPGSPITFRAQTPGTVRIDGTDPVAAWTRVSPSDLSALSASSGDSFLPGSPFAAAVGAGTVYKAHVPIGSSITSPQVFSGDQSMSEAAFPDPAPDPLEPNVEVARAGSTSSTIADAALNRPPGYWTGAHVYLQTTSTALTGVVKSSAPGSVTVVPLNPHDACLSVVPDYTRYFLYGKLDELNAPREWFYDRPSQTLYFRSPTGTQPAPGSVTVKQRLYGFDLSHVTDTTVSGLGFFGTTINTDDATQRLTLASLTVRFPSHFMDFVPDPDTTTVDSSTGCDSIGGGLTTTGVILRGTGDVLRDSTVSDSGGNGVALLGYGNTVTNNVIHDVDSSGGRPAGVHLFGHDQTVTGNTIYSAGRAGIEIAQVAPNGTSWTAPDGNRYTSLQNNRIAYNDISRYGRLEQDFGGIYICCKLDFTGSSIDHNWVHEPQDMAVVGAAPASGIYLDGGSANQLVYANVGWGNNHGAVGLVNGAAYNDRIDDNDGGVWVQGVPAGAGTRIRNTIGDLWIDDGRTPHLGTGSDPGIRSGATNDLASTAAGFPGYVNEAARDFRPADSSPARGAGVVIPGETDGYNDPRSHTPSIGAYQYGAPYWQPGASAARATVIAPDYGASSSSASPSWSWAQQDGALGRNDTHPDYYAGIAPYGGYAADGTLTLSYLPPSGAGLAIDHVEVRVYARMYRPLATDGDFVLSVNGVPVFDADHTDFDATGRPVTIDLTSAVAGNWTKLPQSIAIHATLADAPITCYCFQTTGIEVHAVEVYVQAHPV